MMIKDYLPEIKEYRDDAGFLHPGIGVSASMLRNMQKHVRAGDEPWSGAFRLLSSSKRAGADIPLSYKEDSDDYVNVPFGDGGLRVAEAAQRDADTASKQAVMYVITGDVCFRQNCMTVLRLWMRIKTAALHRDQQIRWGIALYKLCFAAELMRCTSSPSPELLWSDGDEERFRRFLSVVEFTVNGWWYFMNQHSYALKGYMAKTIFCGEREKYNVSIERATVHHAYEPNNIGRNGSIKYQIAKITEDIETGEAVDPPYIEVVECGRDEPHAYGNIGSLSEIAMTSFIQGTRVDPLTGEASDAENAVGMFEFLSDRLLAGAEFIARYNLGHITKYYKTYFDSLNSWNKRHYGRVDPVFGILYHYYRYIAGRDIYTLAPCLCELYEKFSHPESSLEEFIGYSELFYTPDGADTKTRYAPFSRDRNDRFMCADFTAKRRGAAEVMTEDDVRFVRMKPDGGIAEIADRTFGHPALGRAALRYRSDGEASVSIAKYDPENALAALTLPDTGMAWRDMEFEFHGGGEDSTIIFYTVTGNAKTVDLQYLELISGEENAGSWTEETA